MNWSGENGLLGCYTSEMKKLSKRSTNRRVKRWDSIFQIGTVECSVHMGALILGVVGQQLRYFLEVCNDYL